MPIYKWNVRTVRISHDYIEEIVEARTAKEAQEKVDPAGYWDSDKGWVHDDRPEIFINEDYTERMDKLFPDEYANPSWLEGTLAMSQYARGYLYAKGEAFLSWLDDCDEPWDDEWNSYQVSEGEWYSLNLWRDDITGRVHCTAYKEDFNDGVFKTNTTDWARLW